MMMKASTILMEEQLNNKRTSTLTSQAIRNQKNPSMKKRRFSRHPMTQLMAIHLKLSNNPLPHPRFVSMMMRMEAMSTSLIKRNF